MTPEACAGDELLRRLLWRPVEVWTAEDVWGYFSSRPRRYHLEPRLLAVRKVCYDAEEQQLRVFCHWAHRTRRGRRCFWVAHADLLLNPEHAAVLARYGQLHGPDEPADVVRRVAQPSAQVLEDSS